MHFVFQAAAVVSVALMAFRIGFRSSHLQLNRCLPHLRRDDRVALFKLVAGSRRSLPLWPRITSRAFRSHMGDIRKTFLVEQVDKWSEDRVQQWVVAVLEAEGRHASVVDNVKAVFMAKSLAGTDLVTLTVQEMMAYGVAGAQRSCYSNTYNN